MILDLGATAGSDLADIQDKKKQPPPYNNNSKLLPDTPQSSEGESGSKSNSLSTPLLGPSASMNQLRVHLDTGKHDISGTFHVDPRVPNFGFKAKGFKAYKKNPPHASFCTRKGAISLELATTGEMTDEVPKANVLVASRSGNININLLPISPACPHVGLEVISKTGNIILMVPQSFAGVIQLDSNGGTIELLPSFSRAMRLFKRNEKEAFVLLGEKSFGHEINLCRLNSRRGKLIVGFSDLDQLPSKKLGTWKKMFKRAN